MGLKRFPSLFGETFALPFSKRGKLLFFRLYPVIPANARVITEGDIQVGGYLIPKNVSVFEGKRAPARCADLIAGVDSLLTPRRL